MAKAQKRGNREAKKPDKVREPVVAAATLTRGVLASAAASSKSKSGKS